MAWRGGRSGSGRMTRAVDLFPDDCTGCSVAQVALRYAVNANLIFTWLRDARYAPDPALTGSSPSESRFLPVEIVAEAGPPLAAPVVENLIEIELAGGHRMRVSGNYDPDALARLIRGLLA